MASSLSAGLESGIRSVCIVASGSEEVAAVVVAEEVDEFANGDPETLDGSLSRFTQERLELGEGVLDGIEVGTVGREVEEMGASRFDQLATLGPLWPGRLSMITVSPSRSSWTRTFST